ncbi:1,4-dihydroxy-2-naphthoate polyprenyltransferase [Lacihabitans lacunae]|uniref:1,4-dihydroxy-2-naphthoate octaprenyltransferase n=1 Tax=Lacihabitans lacunae TaxID=1028214 RepID=A0ABV7YUR1_9BACT
MKHWIEAARPRTLPLALSSIILGSFLAYHSGNFHWKIFGLAVLTTTLLQILSNFANDYGDSQNGADSSDRVGPSRAVQSGVISPAKMFKAVVIFAFLSIISGVLLLYVSFGSFADPAFLRFFGLGLVCILAAYFYTAGKKPYGYSGFGDISVFLFFGLVGVLGSNFLFTHVLDFKLFLPASACGLLATGVLNLNNIRDIESDKKTGKITIPVRLGKKKAILYHFSLLGLALFLTVIFLSKIGFSNYIFLIPFPLILLNGFQLLKLENPDPLLKRLALSTLVFVICLGLSL